MRRYTILCAAVLCVAVVSLTLIPAVSATGDDPAAPPDFSFSDLLSSWGSAMVDPDTYTAWMRISGFSKFLNEETFLSAFSSNTYGSLDRNTMLGTIPNVFFIVCMIVAMLSVGIAVIEIRKLEASRRAIRK